MKSIDFVKMEFASVNCAAYAKQYRMCSTVADSFTCIGSNVVFDSNGLASHAADFDSRQSIVDVSFRSAATCSFEAADN